ncbi:MAG TPA: CusA/CzcA family heavy metal efflux RND transporter, partial [Usitatibacteraceae bacterium]|nr:CusA/CzcA family heavy metal efflux RND transporter [Usitatibacteraceae bacterium]
DWLLKFELKSVPNVAEVATVGGMVRQYQIVLDPDRLRAFNITHAKVIEAIRGANQEVGGSVLEMGEAEYMVRASGYLKSIEDFRRIPLATTEAGVVVHLQDVARIQVGPEMRRGISELDGEGEVAGGIIVMRSGKNALETIAAVKEKLESLKRSLPPGVEVVPVYDRSDLIKRSVATVGNTLMEQFAVVAIICIVFLFHWRSALVSIISLPLGVTTAFIVMHYQGITANIVSLGGIAIAIGEMVDAAVVMVENAHRKLEKWQADNPGREIGNEERWKLIGEASVEVGPALFSSLLIVTISFIPVFALQSQEGRLFAPLAFTKSYAMAAAAALAVTLVPVLMGYFIRGRIPTEEGNPINRFLIAIYRPGLEFVVRRPVLTIVGAFLAAAVTLWPASRLGGEFLPPLDEGDLLYMPSALPGMSAGKASELLQQTDRLIKSVPEVARVFGKAGRAETATDPAPLEMFETTIQFKPRSEWRPGMTMEKLVEELDRTVKVPGLANIWVPPIRNRIDMLATGIKSPVGVKVSGQDLAEIERIAGEVERAVKELPGVSSALAERLTGGRYIDIDIDRDRAARYGLNVTDVQSLVSAAIGGENIGETIEGLQRFPINVRYPREIRDSLEGLRNLPVLTDRGAQIRLSDIAQVRVTDGAPMIRSENARPSGWVYVDIRGRDLRSVVHDMQRVVGEQVNLPPGYSIAWSGQFEYLERAQKRLAVVVPAMLMIIFIMLYLTFRRMDEALLIMATLPFSLVGGVWLLFALGHEVSVATSVGFIGLAGVTAEFGIVMLVYLKQAWEERVAAGRGSELSLVEAIREGAVLRVRPKAMTVATTVIGLAPILWETGTGSEIMSRIAAPMVGGMVTAPLISMFVVPAAWMLLRKREARRLAAAAAKQVSHP